MKHNRASAGRAGAGRAAGAGAAREPRTTRGEPLAWVVDHLGLIAPGGHVLDIACGNGRHMLAALERGFSVTGVDRDIAAAADLAARPGVRLIEADLEQGRPLPVEGERFAAVIVTNYLWRPLLAELAAAVADDGVLIYETFAAGNERFGRPANPKYLLAAGELLEAVRGRLIPHRYHHGFTDDGGAAVRQGLVATGSRHPALRGEDWPIA